MQEKTCKYYKKCGGCQLDLPYAEQLEYKMNLERKLLGHFCDVSPIIGMYYPYHYRNKVQAAFALDRRSGKIISGVYQSNSHRIVPVDSCNIEDKKADEIIVSIRKLCKDFRFVPRHVLVKRGFCTNQIMVVIVTDSPILPAKRNFCRALLEKHPEITTVIHNINPYDTNLVLGPREDVLFGPGFIEDRLLGCVFRISAKSFYQINPTQTEKLYTAAMEFADVGGKTVLDAYCGTGTIGIIAAKQGALKVMGVELEKAAVRDAISNAKRNNVDNIRFYNADATAFIRNAAEVGESIDVVILDPPRAGSTEEFLDAVVSLAPPRVVYISCNPETLARDLACITKKNYRVTKIQPVDMFPHTIHVETVVLLEQN